MNIYHITYAPTIKEVYLHFWSCNFACQGCIRKKALDDIHLKYRAPAKRHLPPTLLSLEEVTETLKKLAVKKIIYMGGEPTVDNKLSRLLELTHNELHAYNILLTNGFISPPLEDIDEVCLGLKAYDSKLHLDFTGKSNEKVLANFVNFYQAGVRIRAESILMPGYIDSQEIENMAKFIASIDPNIPYRIDAYIPVPRSRWRKPASGEVDKAVSVAKKYLHNVSCLKGNEKIRYKVVKIV